MGKSNRNTFSDKRNPVARTLSSPKYKHRVVPSNLYQLKDLHDWQDLQEALNYFENNRNRHDFDDDCGSDY